MSIALPSVPLFLAVTVTLPPVAEAVTGKAVSALMAAAMAVATAVAALPLGTATGTRRPPMYSATVPAALAVPETAMVPVAATPAPASCNGRIQTSPSWSLAR